MNSIRRALQEAEELLDSRHWVRITTIDKGVSFEAGPVHDNGFQESPTYTGIIGNDGRVSIGHRRT